ncbi:MAG: right-handed parallel beta-helix repeat-containing protein [Candidatus Altiarchaeota archaeon]|nr:right-handed parallel beta-helix repeat-containing protein [Candidatus Altiarchaeota archaeon]
MENGIVVFGILLIMAIESVNAGCVGSTTEFGCGDTVTESCRFNENLNCSTGHGLFIGADAVTIDGNGYTMGGTGSNEGIHNEGYNRVTLKNLNIEGFCFGIYFKDADNSDISNNNISYGVGSGIWLFTSSYNQITNNNIYYGDDGHGILISNSANNNTVKRNSITPVKGVGVSIDDSKGNKLYFNYVCNNARGDIIVDSKSIGTTGDENTCDTADNYDDTINGIPCAYLCPSCSDRTLYGECSVNKPKYCGNGILIDNCSECGCALGYECNVTSGFCYALLRCSDGTPYNVCSANKPKYCDKGELVGNCVECGCPSGYECNTASNLCYAINHGCVSTINSSRVFACGDVVTESCRFNENLNCPSGHGLSIGADGITVNGNGYALDGIAPTGCADWSDPTADHIGIYNYKHDNVVVRNLEIRNFCKGIYFKGATSDPCSDCLIEECGVHHNGNPSTETNDMGMFMCYVENSTITNNKVHHNTGAGDGCQDGGNGIFFYGGGYNVVTNNIVYDNKKAGIFTKMKPKHNNISYNEVTGNGQGGILLRCKLSSFFMIEQNTVTDNRGPGIYVGGAGNTLKYNTVTDNRNGSNYTGDASVANGLRISREADNTTLISNNVAGNDDIDIYVLEGLTGVTGYNNTYSTSSSYEDTPLPESEEKVEGKKMASFKNEKGDKQEKPESGFLASAGAPLIATLIVLIVLAFMGYGYLRK